MDFLRGAETFSSIFVLSSLSAGYFLMRAQAFHLVGVHRRARVYGKKLCLTGTCGNCPKKGFPLHVRCIYIYICVHMHPQDNFCFLFRIVK